MILLCTLVLYYLFHMINCIVYTEVEIQSISPHLLKFLSKKFLGNYPKIANHLFFKKNCLHGYFRKAKNGAKHWKIWFFLYDFNNFNKNWGWRGELVCFIVEIFKDVSGTWKHKLQATVTALRWYLFLSWTRWR